MNAWLKVREGDLQSRLEAAHSRRGPGIDRHVLPRIGFRNISSQRYPEEPDLLSKGCQRLKNVVGRLEHTELIPTS